MVDLNEQFKDCLWKLHGMKILDLNSYKLVLNVLFFQKFSWKIKKVDFW